MPVSNIVDDQYVVDDRYIEYYTDTYMSNIVDDQYDDTACVLVSTDFRNAVPLRRQDPFIVAAALWPLRLMRNVGGI